MPPVEVVLEHSNDRLRGKTPGRLTKSWRRAYTHSDDDGDDDDEGRTLQRDQNGSLSLKNMFCTPSKRNST